jgi:hypothetical protein
MSIFRSELYLEPHTPPTTLGGSPVLTCWLRLQEDWVEELGEGCFPTGLTRLAHRAEAHSMSITGTVGYFMNEQLTNWQASLRNEARRYTQLREASPSLLPQIGYGVLEFVLHFLAGALAGLLAGYASHLALDSLTPSSLPILC